MRASTLFALVIAVLIGLGVAVAARMSGYFNAQKKDPEPALKKQEIPVLIAAKNLFAGDLIDSGYVRVRNLRPEEFDYYKEHKDDYLPALPSACIAAHRRPKH